MKYFSLEKTSASTHLFLADLRWFFSTNNANSLRLSTYLNLRISAWNKFSEFSPRHPNIPHNNSPLKVRGVPPKAGRCYDVGNEELEKWGLRMRSSALFNLRLSTWTYLFFFSQINADLFLADSRWFIFCAHLRFQSANICVNCFFWIFSPTPKYSPKLLPS